MEAHKGPLINLRGAVTQTERGDEALTLCKATARNGGEMHALCFDGLTRTAVWVCSIQVTPDKQENWALWKEPSSDLLETNSSNCPPSAGCPTHRIELTPGAASSIVFQGTDERHILKRKLRRKRTNC